jgi:tRNA(fMet)-specific endonuclease VapC
MTRFLLDTNAMGDFIDHRRGVDARVRTARARGAASGTCLPVAAELFFGAEFSASRDINRPRVVRALSRSKCWPFDRKAVEEYGRIAIQLRRLGQPMQQIDIMVAAVAMSLGNGSVITDDTDLSAVPGLSVESWTY